MRNAANTVKLKEILNGNNSIAAIIVVDDAVNGNLGSTFGIKFVDISLGELTGKETEETDTLVVTI